MITSEQLFNLCTHYVNETNKSRDSFLKNHYNKQAIIYYINDSISNLLFELYQCSKENDNKIAQNI